MSTILKALRRLERDKATPAESRSLREAVTAGADEPRPGPTRPIWLIPGLALLLGIGVGAGFLLLWPRGDVEAASGGGLAAASPELPAPPRPSVEAPAGVPALPAELEVLAERAGLPSAAFASQVEVVARPARQPRLEVEAPPPPPDLARAPRAAAAPGPSRPSPPLSVEVPAPVAQAPKREPDPWLSPPVAPPAPAPRTELPEPEPAPPEPRTRRPELAAPVAPRPTQQRRASSPPVERVAPAPRRVEPPPAPAPSASASVRVERTWWHPVASRREALLQLDGEELRVSEGQRVADATVKVIEPSAVVFLRGETEFRRRVGEAAPPAD